MAGLQAWVRRNLTPLLLLLLAGGYLVILGELVLYRHWEGVQFVGFAASVVGLICVLVGIFVKGGFRLFLAGILLLVSLSGLLGTFEHFEHGSGEGAAPTYVALAPVAGYATIAYAPGADVRQDSDEEREEGEREEGERERRGEADAPPLAPLSLAGLSLMGAAILLAKQD